jgi:hypothetical protein
MSVDAGYMHIATVIREMNYAAARALELKLTRDLGLGDRVPATCAEFLLLTATPSRHEPSAERRAQGRPVR